jgi:hypothetical protein
MKQFLISNPSLFDVMFPAIISILDLIVGQCGRNHQQYRQPQYDKQVVSGHGRPLSEKNP